MYFEASTNPNSSIIFHSKNIGLSASGISNPVSSIRILKGCQLLAGGERSVTTRQSVLKKQHPEGMPASVGHKKDKSRKKGVTEKKGSDPFFGGNDQRNRKSGSIQGTEPLEIITDQT